MDRRGFLATAGVVSTVGLSGCTNVLGGSERTETPIPHHISGDVCPEEPGQESTESASPVPESDVIRRVRLKSSWEVGDIVPLVPSVEVVRNAVTREQTARIRLAIKNIAAGTLYHTGYTEFPKDWLNFTPDASDPEVVLLPTGGDFGPVEPGCWQTTLSQQEIRDRFVGHGHGGRYGYESCEQKSATFDLFGLPTSGDCLPSGEYPFFDRIRVSRSDKSNGIEWDYSWQFTMTVESP